MIYALVSIGFLSLVLIAVQFFGGLVTFSPDFVSAFSTLGHVAGYVNFFLPMDTLNTLLTFTGLFLVVQFTMRVVFYIVAIIRGNSMPGKN